MEKIGFKISAMVLLAALVAFSFILAEDNSTLSPLMPLNTSDSDANDSASASPAEVVSSSDSAAKTDLDTLYNILLCKTNFAIGVTGVITSSDPSAVSMMTAASKVQEDLDKLKSFADSGDSSGFKSYVKSNYDSSLKAEKEAISGWKSDSFSGLSLQAKSKIKGDYAVLESHYKICSVNSLREYGAERISSFNSVLYLYQAKSDDWEAKDVDNSKLDKVIENAREDVIEAMRKDLQSATDAKELTAVISGYCLDDGCKEGKNFHLAAKWEIAKLKTMLNRVEDISDSDKNKDKITELKGYIEKAEDALDSVGTDKYSADQKKEIFDNIKSAYSLVKELGENQDD